VQRCSRLMATRGHVDKGTRGHVDKGTRGQGVVSPLCGVALFEVGIALRAILEASKVGAWLHRALVWIGGQGGALPLPASGARERQLGWHAVPTLPEAVEMGDREAEGRTVQRCKSAGGLCEGAKVDAGRDSTTCCPRGIEAARLARSANPTRGRRRTDATQSRPYLEAARLARSANPTKGNCDSTWCCPYLNCPFGDSRRRPWPGSSRWFRGRRRTRGQNGRRARDRRG